MKSILSKNYIVVYFIIACIVAFIFCSEMLNHRCFAKNILNTPACDWGLEGKIYWAGRSIRSSFDLPINDEWRGVLNYSGDVLFSINVGERLQGVLDRAMQLTGNKIDYEIIHNQLCLVPTKQSKDDVVSPLDVRVSVELGILSTWEAIKEIVVALNQQREYLDKPVFAVPEELFWFTEITPLLTKEVAFNMSLKYVSVREALCAVFGASNLDINYLFEPCPSYERNRYDTLKVQSHPDRYNNSVKFRERYEEMKELCWWYREVAEQKGEWDVIPPYYSESRLLKCGDNE